MSLFKQLAKVRSAQLDLKRARSEFSPPATALLARGQRYPLTTVSLAAGTGLVLGRLNVHPLRVPGLGSLLGGGVAEAVAHGARLFSALGSFDLGSADDGERGDASTDDDGSQSS
ncbi:hypothetical protein [Rhodanobacter sp. BL-MT-08]